MRLLMYPERMTEKESKAIVLCIEAHDGQVDKAGKPYAAHPLRVGFSLWEGTTEDMFCAAVLHDVVEDTAISLDYISHEFGLCVADAIDALTRRKTETYTQFIARCSLNAIAKRVKLADIEDNMRPERIAALPVSEQGITRRYEKARKALAA